jgi:hypothetical protein
VPVKAAYNFATHCLLVPRASQEDLPPVTRMGPSHEFFQRARSHPAAARASHAPPVVPAPPPLPQPVVYDGGMLADPSSAERAPRSRSLGVGSWAFAPAPPASKPRPSHVGPLVPRLARGSVSNEMPKAALPASTLPQAPPAAAAPAAALPAASGPSAAQPAAVPVRGSTALFCTNWAVPSQAPPAVAKPKAPDVPPQPLPQPPAAAPPKLEAPFLPLQAKALPQVSIYAASRARSGDAPMFRPAAAAAHSHASAAAAPVPSAASGAAAAAPGPTIQPRVTLQPTSKAAAIVQAQAKVAAKDEVTAAGAAAASAADDDDVWGQWQPSSAAPASSPKPEAPTGEAVPWVVPYGFVHEPLPAGLSHNATMRWENMRPPVSDFSPESWAAWHEKWSRWWAEHASRGAQCCKWVRT